MKYIIMCGGNYGPEMGIKCLLKVNNETLVEHTIRLLRDLGVEDIAVSTNNDNTALDFLDVKVIKFKNSYITSAYNVSTGYWCDAFYYTDEPCCYLCGDVWYSKKALKQIIETDVKDINFFGTSRPYARGYFKPYSEPLAFKVNNQDLLHESCDKFRKYQDLGKDKWPFCRTPISWELAQIISNQPLNKIIVNTPIFIGVHHFAVDIDYLEDIEKIEKAIKDFNIE